MQKATIQLETLSCPSCLQKIENAMKGLNGIDKDSVKVLFNSSKVKAAFDSNKTSGNAISETIQKLGYEVQSVKES